MCFVVAGVGEPRPGLLISASLLAIWFRALGEIDLGGTVGGWLLSGMSGTGAWVPLLRWQPSEISLGLCRAAEPPGDCREQAGRRYSLST